MKNQFIRYFIFFIISGFISILYLGFIGNTFYNGMINLIAHNYWTVIFLLLSYVTYMLFTININISAVKMYGVNGNSLFLFSSICAWS